jgi:lysyl-tRNA synthetase class 2
MRAGGFDPFQIEKYTRSHTAQEITQEGASHWALEEEERTALIVHAAGRITSQRSKGKVAFYDIRDESGRVQLYVKRDDVGEEAFEAFLGLQLGDIIGVEGFPFITRTGEPSLHVKGFTILTKALRAIPFGKQDAEGVVHGGLSNVEDRYRARYLDLIVNPDSREVLTKRCRTISATRRFLDSQGFLEVETPTLQEEAGGAAARPFVTHHNALDHSFKLRISLELYLKRLIVGGYEKVYEIGRVYRNEGLSTRHNPEFTLMELYQAYVNLENMMELVESMWVAVAQEVNGTTVLNVRGVAIELANRPWRRLPILEGIHQYAGIAPEELTSFERGKAACERVKVPFPLEKESTLGGLIEKLHEVYTQPNLMLPTFITDFPIETSPLAKKHPDNPALTRRFEVYIGTQELGNAFSEINDPLDQRERFENQMTQREAGDAEAHPMDEDFLRALEYGMPPTGGLGIGMDRMVMLLTGAQSIRDVLFFPLMRPQG